MLMAPYAEAVEDVPMLMASDAEAFALRPTATAEDP
jgi:hypothetical protein